MAVSDLVGVLVYLIATGKGVLEHIFARYMSIFDEAVLDDSLQCRLVKAWRC